MAGGSRQRTNKACVFPIAKLAKINTSGHVHAQSQSAKARNKCLRHGHPLSLFDMEPVAPSQARKWQQQARHFGERVRGEVQPRGRRQAYCLLWA